MNKSIGGFTLVELSIVLVIIGLIVGGVVGGQSLIQAGKVQSVVREIARIKTALNTFELQYGALPGDITDAWDYWGTDCATTEALCNGDGNGRVGDASDPNEDNYLWRHLILAGILSGTSDPTLDSSDPNLMYHSEYSAGAGYSLSYSPVAEAIYTRSGANKILIFKGDGVSGLNVIKVKDAVYIDKKIDDGLASQGSVFGTDFFPDPTDTTCTSASYTAPSADYVKGNADSVACAMVFWLD